MGLFGRRTRFEAAYETGLKKETRKQTNKPPKRSSYKTELIYRKVSLCCLARDKNKTKKRQIALRVNTGSGWVDSSCACWEKIEFTGKIKFKV